MYYRSTVDRLMSKYTDEELERLKELDGIIVENGRPRAKMVRNAKAGALPENK